MTVSTFEGGCLCGAIRYRAEPETFEPADHTWVSHKLDWVKITDTLPAYPKTRPPAV